MATKFLFSVIDIETTGLSAGKHELLTAHIIKTDGREKLDEKTFYFKPNVFRPDYFKAQKIHGISIEKAREFRPKQQEILDCFLWISDETIMVCHSKKANHYFDYGFLLLECDFLDMRQDFYKKFKHVISTHTLVKDFTKLKKLDLASICKHYGISLNHHDAKSDCNACFDIFRMFYDRAERSGYFEL